MISPMIADAIAAYWQLGRELLGQLRPRPLATTNRRGRPRPSTNVRVPRGNAFWRGTWASVYQRLTKDHQKFVRVEALVEAAAEAFPGLVPTAEEIAADAGRLQRDKEGVEIDQGIFLSHVLGDERSGTHLCHAMLLPREDTAAHLEKFIADGFADLGAVTSSAMDTRST